MTQYVPGNWAVVTVTGKAISVNRVLAGWKSSYTTGDSWKLSSAVTEVDIFDDRFEFYVLSGSKYVCYKCNAGLSEYTSGILREFKESAKNNTIRVSINKKYDRNT